MKDAYLHLVKAALLDDLYAKDRPSETSVVVSAEMRSGSVEGSYSRIIDFCITQH